MCDCFHLSFPNWHGAPAGGRRLQARQPGTEDDSLYDEPSQLVEEKRPRPQGSSPVEEFPEAANFSDSDKEGGAEHDLQKKIGRGGKRSGLGSLFDKRSTPKMSKLKEVHSPESEVIVKTSEDGGAEGLIVGGGGKDGIFIKQVVPESPAYKNLCVKEGDQILSATVYFDNVTYEDALQIMEHASAYKVKLCLKRRQEAHEEETHGHPESIQEEEVTSPEMRGQQKTKRHSDARISWPKFPSLGKGRKKSHFRRSHSTSEAEDQTRLELSPTTSDTESPITTQEALKGKKKHQVKQNVVKNKGRLSADADQDTDALTTAPLNRVNNDPMNTYSRDLLGIPSDQSPPVYNTHQFKSPESHTLMVEQGTVDMAELESPHHRVELISVDSTLKTEDLTLALARQGSPTANMSPIGKKKKKKEKSEFKMKIKGKDKSHKQDVKVKSSPKRLQTLGASIEVPEHDSIQNLDATKDLAAQVGWTQIAINTDTQVSAGKGFEVIPASRPTEKDLPKGEFSFDMSDERILKRSPRIEKAKPKKESEKLSKGSKQKTDTKKILFKLPTVGFSDAMEDMIEKKNVKDKGVLAQNLTEGLNKDPYDRLPCPSKTNLPKREEMEIPGMEDVSSAGRKKQRIKEPKGLSMNGFEGLPADTVQMSIDVRSVKEAVSKLPGFKLPKVDMEGFPILEEITMIDANAQRITVKSQGTPTKLSDTKTKHGQIPCRTIAQLPNSKAENLVCEVSSATQVQINKESKTMGKLSSVEIKNEGNKKEDISIPGEESKGEEIHIQGPENKQDAFDIGKPTDMELNLTKLKKPSLGLSRLEVKGPEVDFRSSKPDVKITLQESEVEPLAKAEVDHSEIARVKEIESTSATCKATPFKSKNSGSYTTNTIFKTQEMYKRINIEGDALDASRERVNDVDITLPEAKAHVTLPNVELQSPKVRVKGPEIALKVNNGTGSPSKFKMPTLQFPKFGAASPNISLEVPEFEKEVTLDDQLNNPEERVEITVPKVDIKGPSIDLESTGIEGTVKGGTFKMPNLGISMPKVKGTDFDMSVTKPNVAITSPKAKAGVAISDVDIPSVKVSVKGPEIETEDVDGSSKFTMPKFKLPKFGVGSSSVTADLPDVDKQLRLDAELNIPKAAMDITGPNVELEGPSIDLKSTGPDGGRKGSKFHMPSLGLSMPKVKGPDVDFSVSKTDVDLTSTKGKAEVNIPDVDLSSAEVGVEAPELETDADGSYKFKMPKFNMPKFGTGSSGINAEIPDVQKEIKFDQELNIPKATVAIIAPKVELEGPSIDLKSTGPDGGRKVNTFHMPSLGLSMPKVKRPNVDFSVPKTDVDITLPKVKAEVKIPDVDLSPAKVAVEVPDLEKDVDGSYKFKRPKFKLSKFGTGSSGITAEIPDVQKEIKFDAQLNIPKATVDITAPKVQLEGPSIDVKSTGLDGDTKGRTFHMPSLGLSMPKVKGPDVEFSVSKTDVDITLPKGKAEVNIPNVDLSPAKVGVEGPELETDVDGSYKFKMPKFKLPKFGTGSPGITAEIPDVQNEIKFDAELNNPKATLDNTAPKVELEVPSINVKSTGLDGETKGSTFHMPSLGLSMPKVKGPDVGFSVSKTDVDITLPKGKAEVNISDVDLSPAKVVVKGPEIDLKAKDGKGSPSKFKMPSLKFPKFGAASPNISLEIPEVKKEVTVDGELNIPKATVDITAPKVELEGPSVDLKSTGPDGGTKGSTFHMPSLGLSMPKVKGPDVDFSVSKTHVDLTSPKAKAEVNIPDVDLPSARVGVEGPELETDVDGSYKFKMPKFKLPKFGTGSSGITAEIPDVQNEIKFDAELNIPKATPDVTAPKVELERPSINVKSTGLDGETKGSTFHMPSLGLSMPKVKGPDVDFSVSKTDVDIILPKGKVEVNIPDVDLSPAKVGVKGPEIDLKVKDGKGPPSKLKMPSLKFPKFGAASPNISLEIPEVKKQVIVDGELNIPKATVDITAPKVQLEGPSIDLKSTGTDGGTKGSTFHMPSLGLSMPKVKGPDVDFSVSKTHVDLTSPKANAEVNIPDVDLPSANVGVEGPELETDVDGSYKFKMPKFKLPKFGTGSSGITAEMPDVQNEIKFDAELNIPKATLDITAPKVELERPSIDVKSTGLDGDTKGSTFHMPSLGVSMPKVKGPDVDFSVSKTDVDITLPKGRAEVNIPDLDLSPAKVGFKGPEIDLKVKDGKGPPSKFKMPSLKFPKFGAASPNISLEIPEAKKEVIVDGELNIPKATVDITAPKVELEGPSIDLESTGPDGGMKGSTFHMPSLGLSMPKVKGPDVDFSVSKTHVSFTSPKTKAEVNIPDVDLPSAMVRVEEPDLETDVDGSYKFKMPKFKLPKFGTGPSGITAEIPDVQNEIKFDAGLNIPEATVDITAPKVELEGPSIDIKSTGLDGDTKGSTFHMPSLGLSMPKVKGPDVDFSVSKKDVDITMPKGKADVNIPDVDLSPAKVVVKGPEIDLKAKDGKGSPSKFKMPSLKFPKFGAASPNISLEIPEVKKEVTVDGELNIPKTTVDITASKVELEGPSIDLKSTGPDGGTKGSTFHMPSLGLSMPKVKGPDFDFSVSKTHVDLTSPKAKAEVNLPLDDLPSAKVGVEGPELETDVDGSYKFKMPKFKLPKFGTGSSGITAEIPDFQNEIKFDAELNISKATLDITAPNVELEGPSIDIKSTGLDGDTKGSTFHMPSLGPSMPKVKGPDVDFSVSKTHMSLTSPKNKAEVNIPDVDLSPAKVVVEGPEIDLKVKDGKGSPSKFKMPSLKFPKFGAASPNISLEIPEVKKEVTVDGELNIPKATVDITAPKVELEGPSIDLKSTGSDGGMKGSTFHMPSLGLSMPKVKGPDVDFSVSKTHVDLTSPKAKAEVNIPDVDLPSAKVGVEGPELETDVHGSYKFKMPKFKLPKFGTGSSGITAEIPDVQNEINFDAELNIPKATVDITAPKVELEGPSIDVKSTGLDGETKGSTFHMPSLGLSMPKVKGPDVDFSVSKTDVDIILPKGKVEVNIPDVDLSPAKVGVKGPEIDLKVKDGKGPPSKFKMPSLKFPKFGAASPNISLEMPEVKKEVIVDGELNIPKATVDITAPKVELEGPSIDLKSTGPDGGTKGSKYHMPSLGLSMPKVKGPDVDFSVSKTHVSLTSPKTKAEVNLPDVELPSAKVGVEEPELETDVDGSYKFKMPKFKLPKFGTGSSGITAEIPDIQNEIKFNAELNNPEATLDITAPKVELQGPSIDVKSTGLDGDTKGSTFHMPSLGLSMPKVKGPDVDFSVSKTDVDITLPKGKAEVNIPDVDLSPAKVVVKGPEIDLKAKDGKGSPSKFKMPSLKFPKFGAASPNISLEIPEVKKEVTVDGELNIPKATVDITAPKVELEGPSIDLKSTGSDGGMKGSTFHMPSLGLSMPKVKGPDVDFSVSKTHVDLTSPKAKAEVNIPDVDLPSAKVGVEGPELETDVHGSYKFKMPKFKLPKFGTGSSGITAEIPDVQNEIKFDAELNIPKATVNITAPKVELEGPSIDVKSTGLDGETKGSTFHMPSLGLSMPKVKGPDVDFSVSKTDVDIILPKGKVEVNIPDVDLSPAKVGVKGPEIDLKVKDGKGPPSKFKMPSLKFPKFGAASPNISLELPEVKKEVIVDGELNIPKGTVDITAPKVELEGPSIDLKSTGPDGGTKGSKYHMPSLGLSMPKVKGPDVDFSVSKTHVSLTSPKTKAEVNLPDVELPSAKVGVEEPELETDVDGSYKFKMPKFKLPKFGTGSSGITAEIPDIQNEIKFNAELNNPEATLDITAPKVELQGPSIDVKSTGLDGDTKGSTFHMPSLGLSMPKVKGPDVDFSVSKTDVDITLPKGKAEVNIPDVDLSPAKVVVKGPEIDLKAKDGKGSPSKFKMPSLKFPKFGAASPNISIEIPEVKKEVIVDGELNIPKATVDITAPKVELEGPSIDLKSTGPDGGTKGSTFHMPSLGLSMPKVKGPDVDFSVSKTHVDLTSPKAKAEVNFPCDDLPSAKVGVEGPELETDVDGSYKFKMPKFKLPKFGTGSSGITAEIPDIQNEIKFDAKLNIPKATVDITGPKVELKGPSINVKSTGLDGETKGSTFHMPSLGLSMPKVKGPDVDFSVSKKDVDITLPKGKAEVNIPDVDLSPAKVVVKGPEIDLKAKDGKGSPSKFKMPSLKFPKFGAASPNISLEIPEVKKEVTVDGELNIPKATVDITAPKVELEGPSIDVKSTGPDGGTKGSTFHMPSLGLSMPKVKGPDVDFSVSKKHVDLTSPKAKAEVNFPCDDLPSAKVGVEGPELETDVDGSYKFKMPKFKLPKFGTGSSGITAEIPDVQNEIKFDAELNIPKATLDITAPKVELERPCIDVKSTGLDGDTKGSTFHMPSLGLSMPKVKGPDVDFNVSKTDVDITMPKGKADVNIPGVDLSPAKVGVKGTEIALKIKDGEGSPSKFKMPSLKFPKFGAASPNISLEIPEVKKEVTVDGELNIPKVTVDITAHKVELERPSIDLKSAGPDGGTKGSTFHMPSLGLSIPKVKGPNVDFSVSKTNVDLTSPKAKAEVNLPDLDLPSAKVIVEGPELETDVDGSYKFKMPKFKLPKFGTGSSGITAEIPDVQNEIQFDAELNIPKEIEDITAPKVDEELNIPKATLDITAPKVQLEGPSIDVKSTGPDGGRKGSTFHMPSLGISMPKVKGPDVDFNVSKTDVGITLPKAKAEFNIPDEDLSSAEVEVKGPETDLKVKAGKGSPSKFKMPSFKFPKFGAASPNIPLEMPQVKKEVTVDGELNIPKATVDIIAPKVELEGPSIDLKSTGPDGVAKGSTFHMPSLGLSMPKVKGPNVDLSVSKTDVDFTSPKGKDKVYIPDVDLPSAKVIVEGPELEKEVDDSYKFKMPKFKLPTFGTGSSGITAEIPDVQNEIKFDAELNIPKVTVDITAPEVELEGPSIDVKSTGLDGDTKGSTFHMPSLGLSMPKVKGSDVDFSVSKTDVDITLPKGKAEVNIPDVDLSLAKVGVKGPEIDLKVKDGKGSLPKFKTPSLKSPKFGAASPNISLEIPEKEVTVDAELNIPKATVDIAAPIVEFEGTSIVLKSKGPDGGRGGGTFHMPSLGKSMPIVKGPDVDCSVSKTDVDITTPKGKAEVTIPDVDLSSPEVGVRGPEIDLKVKDGKGFPSMFKMPTFKFPKFGAASPNISLEIPEVKKEVTVDGKLNVPEKIVDITAPEVDIKGPSMHLVSTGIEGAGKGNTFKMPNLGISMPKVKGSDLDLSLSKPDVDITLPKAKAEVTIPDDLPSAKCGGDGTENEGHFQVCAPNFSMKTPSVNMTKTKGTYFGRKDFMYEKTESVKMPTEEYQGKEAQVGMYLRKELAPSEDHMLEDEKVKKPRLSLPSISFSKQSLTENDFESPEKETEHNAAEGSGVVTKKITGHDKQRKVRAQFMSPEPLRSGFSPTPDESPDSLGEDQSTAGSLQFSDAFADTSSMARSEPTGSSFTSTSKVTVKYSGPDTAVELGEVNSSIITSTTRSAQISFEPNLPEKFTILSSGVSSSSVDTVKLESDQIHVIKSNIQATPQVLKSTILTSYNVQSPLDVSMNPEFREAVAWSLGEPQENNSASIIDRHITRENSSQERITLSKETVVLTQQLTRRGDQVEPISDETACSIQRLRDTVHSEKMRFFDGTQP